MTKQKIISIVGRKNSGKSTLISKLIPYYRQRGFSVSVLKNTHHEIFKEEEGKDTGRFLTNGADSVILSDKKHFRLIKNREINSNIDIINRYFEDSDIIFIEGDKQSSLKKIEIIGQSKESPLFQDIKNVQFLISDKKIESSLEIFKRDEIDLIADAIKKYFF